MPIYEYICEACGSHLDLLQKMNEPTPPVCQNCGASNTLKKRISMSAFHLKGGGWYSELYASPKNKEAPKETPKKETPNAPAPSPCAGCPAASNSSCANAQKP